MKLITLILPLLLVVAVCGAPMQLVLLDSQEYPEAVCLDGTQGGFYYQKGYGSGANKLMLYFEGGGACLGPERNTMLTSCYQRSFTELGSSKDWSSSFYGYGVLQDSQTNNPQFYNWNKVFIKYCGGTAHQGYNAEPIKWLGKDLYFRGSSCSEAIFNYAIKHYNLSSSQTTDVLLTGTSAGGLGTFYYADYVQKLVSKSTKYWAAPDSGLFINYYENSHNFLIYCIKSLLQVVDLNHIQPPNCPYINDPELSYKCVLPQYFASKINSDLYIIQSEYDEFTLSVFEGVECFQNGSMANCSQKQKELVQNFREKTIEDIEYIVDNKYNSNAWSIACIRHGFFQSNGVYNGGDYEVPAHSGRSSQEALYQWMYSSPSNREDDIDKYKWPLNTPCNGLNGMQVNMSD